MPDISTLMEQASKKKFKKSTYRPWNYLDEIEKEQAEKTQEDVEPVISVIAHETASVATDQVVIDAAVEQPLVAIKPLEATSIQIPPVEIPPVVKHEPVTVSYSDIAAHAISADISKNKEDSTHPLYIILRLSGHQKTIFHFILERCLSRGLLSSGMITSDMLTTVTHTSLSMVNTSIQRLVEKKLLSRENGKRGRGGFYCFSVRSDVKDAAMQYKKMLTHEHVEVGKTADTMINAQESTKIDARKITTNSLPLEWENIDIEPLAHIGFSQQHLMQLYKQPGLEATTIQESIYHFAFDMKHNNKNASITKSSPLGYFMGILKRSGLYTAPDNYESPRDVALREMLARRKQEKEKRDAMLKELINIAFDEWQATLTTAEKDNLLPDEIRRGRLMAAKVASLKTYFIDHIWPSRAPKELDLSS